ncbi:MAG TPA: PKD domain-containing protein [Thermoplasmata archaeon]|nr:PKD domain-containing protein [Thermoplasmata archaeon]
MLHSESSTTEFRRGAVGVLCLVVVVALAISAWYLPIEHVSPLSRAPAARSRGALSVGNILPDLARPLAPDAAFTLSVAGTSPAAIALSWTDPGSPGFSQYAVRESTAGATGPWTSVGIVTASASDTQFAVTSLSPGGTYWWEVTETYFLGATETTNVVSQLQPAVAYLNSTGVPTTTVTLDWTNNASYGGLLSFWNYEVYEKVNGTPPSVVSTLDSESARSDTVSGLNSGSNYSFYIVTDDCAGTCGAANLSATQSNTISIGTGYPLAASVSATRPAVDVGQPDDFTCTATGGKSPYTFAWDFGTGTYVSGNSSVGAAFGASGTPTITCKVTDNASAVVPASTSVTVYPAAVMTAVANRTAADVGQPVLFNCTVSGGSAPYTIGWTFGDGDSAVVGVVPHVYQSAGSMVATCSGTDGEGVQLAGAVSLTISPKLDSSASVNSTAAAPGTSLAFTAAGSNGSGAYPWLNWTFGDGSNGAGPAVDHAYSSIGTYTAVVAVTDSNGETASAQVVVTVTNISVTLESSPSATVGAALTFTAVGSGGAGGPYNYTWNLGDGSVAYGASLQHVYHSAGTFTPTLVVRDRLGATDRVSVGAVTVSPAALPLAGVFPWVLLLLALVVGLIVGAVAYRRRRAAETAGMERLAGWVPPTASHTAKGMKVCTYCNHANLPIRRTCSACGKPLPRSPVE